MKRDQKTLVSHHAWSFSAEGELKAARFMPEDLKRRVGS